MARWRASLEILLPLMRHEEYLARVLRYNMKRVYSHAEVEDFTGSYCVYKRKTTLDKIERYLHAIDMKKMPLLSMHKQIQFLVAPSGYIPRHQSMITIFVGGSIANQHYTGHYEELFDDEQKQPIPTWPVLTSILEDYGMSFTGPIAVDLIYKHISGPWSFEPPLVVQVHPQFCLYARKRKWAPDATIASI